MDAIYQAGASAVVLVGISLLLVSIGLVLHVHWTWQTRVMRIRQRGMSDEHQEDLARIALKNESDRKHIAQILRFAVIVFEHWSSRARRHEQIPIPPLGEIRTPRPRCGGSCVNDLPVCSKPASSDRFIAMLPLIQSVVESFLPVILEMFSKGTTSPSSSHPNSPPGPSEPEGW